MATPVADVAVTATSMDSITGIGMGERTLIAILNAAASGRISIGECLTIIHPHTSEKSAILSSLQTGWLPLAKPEKTPTFTIPSRQSA